MSPWQNCPIRNQMWVHVAGFSIMGRIEGTHPPPFISPPPPHRPKLWLITPYFPKSPTLFAPKMLILLFLCSFWLFWPKVPPTVDPRWKILCDCMARMLMPTIMLHPDGVFWNTDFPKLACSMLFKSIHKVFHFI